MVEPRDTTAKNRQIVSPSWPDASRSRREAAKAESLPTPETSLPPLPGWMSSLTHPGGIAALNHRLLAGNPPGSTPRTIRDGSVGAQGRLHSEPSGF